MTTLIIVLGAALLLFIMYLIFRLGSLVNIAKGRDRTGSEVSPNNGIHGVLFVIFMVVGLSAFFWYSYTHFDEYRLPIASAHGVETDSLFWVTMAVTVIAFTIISIVMFIFLFKYQYKEGRRAKFYPDNHYLELAWTVIPALVLMALIVSGLWTWNDITAPASADAEVIELVAQQFAWTARYPGTKDEKLGKYNFKLIDPINEFGLDLTDKNSFDDFKSLELHLPKGKEVLLKIRAKDVIHSVFLPHFRLKMDAVPGMYTQFKFTPTKSTEDMRNETGNNEFNYELACTEICGQGHFSMRMPVVVDEPEDYEKWKKEQDSWLKLNPDYMEKVPAGLKEAAMIKAGIPVEAGVAAMQSNVQAVVGTN